MNFLNQNQIEILKNIAIKSGEMAMESFGKVLQISKKSDNSLVTKTDIIISKFIGNQLTHYFPDIEIICEEGENRRISKDLFWLVDPIDGTNSFIENNPQFTVNIALIKNNLPIFGVIYAPAMKDAPLYFTDENNRAREILVKKNQQKIIQNNFLNHKSFRIITSKRTADGEVIKFCETEFSDFNLKNTEIIKCASSFKFCQIINDKADFYLHLRRSMEWDIAAGHALLLACGGSVFDFDKNQITYNKPHFVNPSFFAKIKN